MTNQAALPESIQRQIAEAEAIEKQLYGESAPEGNTDPVSSPETDPEPSEPVVEAVVQQPEVTTSSDEDSFRRRYEVLQGKYQAEVPRLHAQLREATENLSSMRAEFTALKEQLTQKPVTQEQPDNDAETFGEDLTEAIDRRAERKARALVESELKNLRGYINELEAKLGTVNERVQVSAQDRFVSQLAAAVPDYEAVNADQGFLDWLGETDPVYGLPRQAALDNAANALDSARVASIFNAYKTLTGKQVQTEQKNQVRKELERQVAPKTTAASAATPPSAKIWSLAEYEAALNPRNIYSMGRAEADALVAEAEQALVEGRVR